MFLSLPRRFVVNAAASLETPGSFYLAPLPFAHRDLKTPNMTSSDILRTA